MLTAVPEIIFLLVICKTGTNSEDKLAFPAKIQNIIGIRADLMLNHIIIQIIIIKFITSVNLYIDISTRHPNCISNTITS